MASGLSYLQSRCALLTLGSAAAALIMSQSLVAFACFLMSALITSVLYFVSALRDRDRTSILVQGSASAFMLIALIGATMQAITPR